MRSPSRLEAFAGLRRPFALSAPRGCEIFIVSEGKAMHAATLTADCQKTLVITIAASACGDAVRPRAIHAETCVARFARLSFYWEDHMYCHSLRGTVRFARVSLLLLFAAAAGPPPASAQWTIVQVTVAPPPLPYYEQPAMPAAGYIWTPGYWAWNYGDYYWVPGTWVAPPAIGLLWTPGYWIFRNNIYYWSPGYWGQHVGFYGGLNYGYGYAGIGYAGGHWSGSDFRYNSTVNNFGNVSVENSYEQTVVDDNTSNVSFNGGIDGTTAMPNQEELAAAQEYHTVATMAQVQHQAAASNDVELRASANGGHPPVTATSYSAHFRGPGVTGTNPGHRWPAVQNHRPPWAGGAVTHNPGMGGPLQHQQPPWAGGAVMHNPGMGGSFQHQPPPWAGGAVTPNPGMGGSFQHQPPPWTSGAVRHNPG